MQWSKQSFRILMTTTEKMQEGYVSGPWGIHKHEKGWVLTLIPSGMAVRDTPTLAKAKQIAEHMNQAGGWEAVKTSADTTPAQLEAYREIRRMGF
ncbi:hypothetical protein UFOVP785_89 [uncultured Caudovirales phage]|uniref:Uncharacterized protein n=1 Tax=uncultured Caudovirales phage TaxID=2100421 RepID=A0A6J5NV86_9CAUD|nr:hypothetical protein UFOVP785_89 [uncultured Caudovirales phage]